MIRELYKKMLSLRNFINRLYRFCEILIIGDNLTLRALMSYFPLQITL